MVTTMALTQEEFLAALRQWLGEFPSGVLTLVERKLPHCVELKVTPRREDAANLTLEVMPYGKFDFYCGRGFMLEGLELDIDNCLELVEAVRNGRLREKLWIVRGRARQNVSTLATKRETYVVRGTSSLLAWLATPVERQYAPWT